MQKSPVSISRVERDPHLFMWFLTLVVGFFYVTTLINVPSARQPGTLIVFTVLTLTHIILHWQLSKIAAHPSKALWYIAVQGVLALVISSIANDLGMVFALFMGLLGEAIGLFGLTRRGGLAAVYYLLLLAAALVQLSGWSASGWLMLSTIPMAIFVITYVALYMRQMEAREQAQLLATELETANRQLAEYAAQVEDLTIANERQRMARELHDTLSQGLAGIILQLEAVEAHLANSRPKKAKNIVANAMLQARATLADARDVIDDLRKTSPDDLDTALRFEISRFTSAIGIPCIFQADQMPFLPAPVKETIIRVVAEGLTNIARHAQAEHVAINAMVKDNTLLVEIHDDGTGFDVNEIPSGHYGLLGIRERVRLVNGTLDIHSEASKGTTLKVQIPL
ncbi:MAG: sensor histidine kinase [Chloroflexi bacterium]|nr:sensor histidine kinase [Chloroflexota bacterium]